MARLSERQLRGLSFDRDLASRRDGQRLEKFCGQLTARLPVLEANDLASRAVALDEPRRGALDAHAVLVPPIEAQPCDICGPVVVAVHGVEATPRATR